MASVCVFGASIYSTSVHMMVCMCEEKRSGDWKEKKTGDWEREKIDVLSECGTDLVC